MPPVTFDTHTKLPPERALAMLTDFSARRPELRPRLACELYHIFEVHVASADASEGSPYFR
jgi:hypothetical protein